MMLFYLLKLDHMNLGLSKKPMQIESDSAFYTKKEKPHFKVWLFISYHFLDHPLHISQLSGSSKEQAISASRSSSVLAIGAAIAFLSNVNLIASVAAFVLR